MEILDKKEENTVLDQNSRKHIWVLHRKYASRDFGKPLFDQRSFQE
jgi:hypothetical protein